MKIAKKRYIVLQRRLHDLESDISTLLSQTPTPSSPKHRFIVSIHRKFDFLKTLLSAEFSSSPRRPHAHHRRLHRIARRLSELEAAFRNSPLHLLNYSQLPDHHTVGDNDKDNDNDSDSESICSCTESCLNDDDNDDDDDDGDDGEDDVPRSLHEECGSLVGEDGGLNDFLCGDDEHYNKEDGIIIMAKGGDNEKDEASRNKNKRSRKIVIVFSCLMMMMIIGVLMVGYFSRFHVGDLVVSGDFVLTPT